MDHMIPCSLLVSIALFYTMTNTLVWDAPGDVLAASASALCGWKGVNSLSLSLSLSALCGWTGVNSLSLSLSLSCNGRARVL